MGFFDDALLVGGGLAFAEHEHHKHQMQRDAQNAAFQGNNYGSQSRGMDPGYGQQQGGYYGQGQNTGYYGQQQGYGQDMVTVPRSEWDRLQREASEGRQMMQRYMEKLEDLERERRQFRNQ
jgi:hypothetical protein